MSSPGASWIATASSAAVRLLALHARAPAGGAGGGIQYATNSAGV